MSPRILLFDLEILPDLEAAMRLWPQLSSKWDTKTLKAQVTSTICFGYKWLDEKETHCLRAWDYPEWNAPDAILKFDDSQLLKDAREILASADAFITHNGKRFDWRYFQTRLLLKKFDLLPEPKHTDTCSVSKSKLLMFDNRLATLSEALTDVPKMDHGLGWDLWYLTWKRDAEKMQIMVDYCKRDVDALEAVFKRLRPVITSLPNHNLFDVAQGGKFVCPNCGSSRLHSNGLRATATRTYRRYQCLDCKAWSRTDANDRLPRSL